jgi:hypothetical protein
MLKIYQENSQNHEQQNDFLQHSGHYVEFYGESSQTGECLDRITG